MLERRRRHLAFRLAERKAVRGERYPAERGCDRLLAAVFDSANFEDTFEFVQVFCRAAAVEFDADHSVFIGLGFCRISVFVKTVIVQG